MNTRSVARRVLNARTVAALTLAVGAGLAQAASDLDFDLLNSTNQPIVAIWATPSSEGGWHEPFSNTFVPQGGGRQRVNFSNPTSCWYDLRVQFSEGAVRVWRQLDLCHVNRFRIDVQDGEVQGYSS